jgi:hypothetical protein
LVEVGSVGVEEFLRPESGKSAGEEKSADEYVSGGATKVGGQIAFEYGDYGVHVHDDTIFKRWV